MPGSLSRIVRPLAAALAAACLGLLALAAAGSNDRAPTLEPRADSGEIQIFDARYQAPDGLEMPVTIWQPAGPPRAVVVAAHGINDYRLAWSRPAARWAQLGIITYAIDQRGFGAAGQRGQWYGAARLAADLASLAHLAAQRHPAPVFLIGESMGGAVAILAARRAEAPPLAGLILSAPALWPASFGHDLARGLVEAGSLLLPDLTFAPPGVIPAVSDDPAVIAQLHSDPMIIKRTRLETVAGVVEMMAMARERAGRLTVPTLILFGDDDRQVPRDGVAELAAALPKATVALYPGGRHLLFRSLDSSGPTGDVAAWILHPDRPLPSGAGRRGELCRRHIATPSDCPALTELATTPEPRH